MAIVCAMWLTGFDVECLSTLYIDKPMKAHTLMQAIARANRVYPGKDFGLIVDYNGMLKSLREALAQYAAGDEDEGERWTTSSRRSRSGCRRSARPSRQRRSICAGLGSIRRGSLGAKGFARIKALRDAVEAVYTSDEAKRRFEIMARQVFIRFKALIDGAERVRLCRAARQHRGDLQEARGAARHRRRDRAAQRAAPDRQRGDPSRRRRARTRPRG